MLSCERTIVCWNFLTQEPTPARVSLPPLGVINSNPVVVIWELVNDHQPQINNSTSSQLAGSPRASQPSLPWLLHLRHPRLLSCSKLLVQIIFGYRFLSLTSLLPVPASPIARPFSQNTPHLHPPAPLLWPHLSSPRSTMKLHRSSPTPTIRTSCTTLPTRPPTIPALIPQLADSPTSWSHTQISEGASLLDSYSKSRSGFWLPMILITPISQAFLPMAPPTSMASSSR